MEQTMGQFQAFSQSVTVNGPTVLSIVDAMGSFKDSALKILARHGIQNPTAAGWYSQQAFLDAFQEIFKSIGVKTLYLIGQSIPKNANFPPGIQTIEQALSSIDVAYHMNHRGGEIGKFSFAKTADRSGTMLCRNPYPCDFDRGIIEAMAQRFKPKGAIVMVQHDSTKPCRKNQGDSCTFLISW